MGALHIEHRTLRSSSRSTFDSENRPNPMRTTPSHQAPPSTLSSWRRSTRLDPGGSGTTTSIRRSDELLPFTHRMKSMPTFSLSWMPQNWFDAWVPRNTSCPPSRPNTKVDDVGVERSSSEGMSILMNGRRSRKPTRLRVTRSTRTPSITGFCRWSQTPISTTLTSRSSSTSHRSTMTLRLHIDARSAAETKSSKRSLLRRLRAL